MKVLALTASMLLVTLAAYGVVEKTDNIPMHDFRVLITQGKVVTQNVMLEGKTTSVPAVKIVQVMNAQGEMLNAYQNRTLTVVGPLKDEVLALRGREVVVRGIVRKGNLLQVTWIQEKTAASENIHAPTPVW